MKKYSGVGTTINYSKPYILFIQHPVTTSFGDGQIQINELLKALSFFSNDYQIIGLWPNIDAGSNQIAKGIRVFRENKNSKNFHFYINFSPEDFLRVINNSACCVGNSSSFLREGEYLDVPAVIVGNRQVGREMGKNAIESYCREEDIIDAIKDRLKYRKNNNKKVYMEMVEQVLI